MIEFSTNNGVVTVRITGRFDFRCVKQFQAGLTYSDVRWVVDLAEVEYVDSAALGLLLLLREHAARDAHQVTLRAARGQPREVLMMAKFDRMFAFEA